MPFEFHSDSSEPTTRADLKICHYEAEYAGLPEHRLRPTLRLELPEAGHAGEV
ncbi:hypothetical protein GE21DRAFT_1222966 [Neurospora crassa]|nr:hypothetical protein GE21DRAFT_1222966 [Neurospora crassa]